MQNRFSILFVVLAYLCVEVPGVYAGEQIGVQENNNVAYSARVYAVASALAYPKNKEKYICTYNKS